MNSLEPDSAARPTYEALVAEHSARVWRLAYRLTGDHQEAEDLTQEAFLEAWRSLPSLRSPAASGAWLCAILVHRAARRHRRRQAHPDTPRPIDDESDPSPLPGPDIDMLARREELQLALDALDPDRRVAFLLVFQAGCSCREAAERLGIPLGTVLSRVHRARGDLRRFLRRGEAGDECQRGRGQQRGGGA